VRAPVLVIAGEDDRHVTRAQTERLFAAAHSPRALWLIPGGRHEDLHRVAGDAYERRVTEFFAAWLPRQP